MADSKPVKSSGETLSMLQYETLGAMGGQKKKPSLTEMAKEQNAGELSLMAFQDDKQTPPGEMTGGSGTGSSHAKPEETEPTETQTGKTSGGSSTGGSHVTQEETMMELQMAILADAIKALHQTEAQQNQTLQETRDQLDMARRARQEAEKETKAALARAVAAEEASDRLKTESGHNPVTSGGGGNEGYSSWSPLNLTKKGTSLEKPRQYHPWSTPFEELNPLDESLDGPLTTQPPEAGKGARRKDTPHVNSNTPAQPNQQEGVRYRKARVPQLPEYDGTAPWETFRSQFTTMSKLCGWNAEERLMQLTGVLRGEAAEFVFTTMDAEDRECAESILSALGGNFHPTISEDAHITAFEQCTLAPGEDVARYVASLKKACTRAYPKLKSQDRERIALRQFLKGVPTTARQYLGPLEPKSLTQAEGMYRRFIEYNPAPDKAVKPNVQIRGVREAQERGPVDDAVLQAIKEQTAHLKQQGDTLVNHGETLSHVDRMLRAHEDVIHKLLTEAKRKDRQAPNAQRPAAPMTFRNQNQYGPPRRSLDDVQCYDCWDWGHIARNCPMRRQSGKPSEN